MFEKLLDKFSSKTAPAPQQTGAIALSRSYNEVWASLEGPLAPHNLLSNDQNLMQSQINEWKRAGEALNQNPKRIALLIVRQIAYSAIAKKADEKLVYDWANLFPSWWGSGYTCTPQEIVTKIAEVKQEMSGPRNTQPAGNELVRTQQPPTQKPGIVPHTTEIRPVPVSLQEKGGAIAEAFTAHNCPAMFQPQESCGDGPRLMRLVFSKPVEKKFSAYVQALDEALSHGGISPEAIGVTFERLENNRFAVYILKPQNEWRAVSLLDYERRLMKLSNQGSPVTIARAVVNQRYGAFDPSNDPIALFGCDQRGYPVEMNPCYGTFFGGKSRSGKTTGMCTLGLSLALRYPAWFVQFWFLNLEDSLTFKHFKGLPHTRMSVSDKEELLESLKLLAEEVNDRREKLDSADVAKIQDYNKKFPEKPMPWLFVFIDELAVMKVKMNSLLPSGKKSQEDEEESSFDFASFNAWMSYHAATTLKYGVVLIPATQYPSEKLSVGPDTRINFENLVGYKGNENMGDLLFGTSQWSKQIVNLGTKGDCIASINGSISRLLTLYADDAERDLIISAIASANGGLPAARGGRF